MAAEVVIEDLAGLQTRVSREFAERTTAAIAAHDKAIVALPGGSIADAFFPQLAGIDLDWSRIHFFWTDERAVPPDHPESNFGRAARLWLEPAAVPAPCIHRMRAEDPDLGRAAQRAAGDLLAVAGDPPRIDVALVGVGEDGHIASIFPGGEVQGAGTEALRYRFVAPIQNSPKPPAARLTLTMDVLAGAECVMLVALGSTKTRAIHDVVQNTRPAMPAGQLLQRARSALLLLDREAAGLSR